MCVCVCVCVWLDSGKWGMIFGYFALVWDVYPLSGTSIRALAIVLLSNDWGFPVLFLVRTQVLVSVSEDARHTLFLARRRYTGSTMDVLELPSVKAKVHRTCFLRWTWKRRVLRTTFRPNSECKVPNSGSAICSTDESISYYYLCKCDLTAT